MGNKKESELIWKNVIVEFELKECRLKKKIQWVHNFFPKFSRKLATAPPLKGEQAF